MKKMHLVSILYKGNIHTAFVTFPEGKPVLNQDTLDKVVGGVIGRGNTYSIG